MSLFIRTVAAIRSLLSAKAAPVILVHELTVQNKHYFYSTG
ncbi:hypothetical protein [Pseudobutyrivibrio ruminis]|nr:hypothetical protein [Pseudobutyrivibrio ruminis]